MSRPTMRLLSSRLRCLQKAPRASAYMGGVRASSRYSNPGVRSTISAAPSQAATFTQSRAELDSLAADSASPSPTHDAAAQRKHEEIRARQLQRMRFAGIGLLLSVAGLSLTLYNLDLDDIEKAGKKNKIQLDAPQESNEKFQGRPVHVIGAGEDKRVVAEGKEETDLVETGSGSVPYFPRKIYLPASEPPSQSPATAVTIQTEDEYTLVGLGIRTVTIFGIEVYVMGMYIRTQDISAVQSRFIHLVNPDASTLVPSEKDDLKRRLLDPQSSTEIWETLLREEGIRSVWRVVPSKNTDFAHLRDGWMNGIKRAAGEIKQYVTTGPGVTEYNDESFGLAVKSFRDTFTGGGKAPKGSTILMLREASGALEILFQDPRKKLELESIGKIQDPRIGRLIWIAYLGGKNVSSEPARQSVVDGYLGMAGRPVGSVETMVR